MRYRIKELSGSVIIKIDGEARENEAVGLNLMTATSALEESGSSAPRRILRITPLAGQGVAGMSRTKNDTGQDQRIT